MNFPLQSLASGLLTAGGLFEEQLWHHHHRHQSQQQDHIRRSSQPPNERETTSEQVAEAQETQQPKECAQDAPTKHPPPCRGSIGCFSSDPSGAQPLTPVRKPNETQEPTMPIHSVITTNPEMEVFNPLSFFLQRSLPGTPSSAFAGGTFFRQIDVCASPGFRNSTRNNAIPPPPPSLPSLQPAIHMQMAEAFTQGLQQIQATNNNNNIQTTTTKSTVGLVLHCDTVESAGTQKVESSTAASAAQTFSSKLLPFLKACQAFQDAGKEVDITLGYHYTNQAYLQTIRQYGLLTSSERRKRGISVRENGSTHGDGIYTSSNPFAFRDFRKHADVALLVLRLSGNTHKHGSTAATQPKTKVDQLKHADSLTQQRGIGKDLLVLKESSQCVVLGEFPSTMLDRSDASERILVSHGKIHKLIKHTLRQHFRYKGGESVVLPRSEGQPPTTTNTSKKATKPSKRSSSPWDKYGLGTQVKRHASLSYGMPRRCLLVSSIRDIAEKLDSSRPAKDQECPICFETLRGSSQLLKLKKCSHAFHHQCLTDALKFDPKCPVCRTAVSEPQGKMPSGKLLIGLDETLACEGFEPGTWRLRYTMKSGVQRSYHVNPGVAYSGTTREAFVPNTEQGRRLLKRLAYAFSRGLTFTIGTSLTSGKDNVIVWGSIHHKTRHRKGPYGFPDPTGSYWINVNEELDALGVPPHNDPSLHIVFSTACSTSVNFGYLYADLDSSTAESRNDETKI